MHQAHHSVSSWRTARYVALGGAGGGLVRWALAEGLGQSLGLITVNVIGCVLIGLLYGSLDVHPGGAAWLKPLIGTGFLGGFTSFSSVILLTSLLADANHWGAVVGVMVGLPLACVMGVWLGHHLIRRWETLA